MVTTTLHNLPSYEEFKNIKITRNNISDYKKFRTFPDPFLYFYTVGPISITEAFHGKLPISKNLLHKTKSFNTKKKNNLILQNFKSIKRGSRIIELCFYNLPRIGIINITIKGHRCNECHTSMIHPYYLEIEDENRLKLAFYTKHNNLFLVKLDPITKNVKTICKWDGSLIFDNTTYEQWADTCFNSISLQIRDAFLN